MTQFVPRSVENSPGLFVNSDWQPGTPGTFAVVIGVSAYPHLQGGKEFHSGDEAFTLGQLHVSAATARAFFEWLSNHYDFPDAVPAMCWMLLSPSERELQAFGATKSEDIGAAPATLANCELALQSWYDAMAQVSEGSPTKSRSLFFFSGHGLEVAQEAQILLPSDYLRRPGRSVNDAISTANLLKGLGSSGVTNHFLFIDACRNDVPRLREYVVEGRQILNVRASAATNPDSLVGILYAAASGTETWQPRELEQGLSLFGGALVQGLTGVEGVEREGCDGHHCEIRLYPLQSFVKARMTQLLSEFSSPEKARVRQGGSPPDAGITLVPETVPPRWPGAAPPSPAQALMDRYDLIHTDFKWAPGQDWQLAHRIFGSERMTDIWDLSARAHDLGTGVEVPRTNIVISEVRRSSDTKAYQISVQLPWSRDGHWLSFTDPRGQRFAMSLASSNEWESPIYQLVIDFELDTQSPVDASSRLISSVEARLSPRSGGVLGRIAEIWSAYEAQNVAVAVRELDVDDLRLIVMEKHDSPLAATVAAVLLLRARRLDLLPASWLANLSNWFPENPDAPVLRVERERLRQGAIGTEALEHLGRLMHTGLPRLSELLPVAWRQLAESADAQPNTQWHRTVREKLRRAMRYYRPGGLFAVYASPTDPLEVELVATRPDA